MTEGHLTVGESVERPIGQGSTETALVSHVNSEIPYESEDSLYIASSVYDLNVDFLIDTGSTLTVLRSDMFLRIPLCSRPSLSPKEGQIKLANGEFLEPLGEVSLPIRFGEQVISHSVVVADIEAQGIMGMDILRKHGGILDVSEGILAMGPYRHRCFVRGIETESIYRVMLSDTVVLPPHSEMIVTGQCKESPCCVSAIVEPSERLLKKDLLLAKAVVDLSCLDFPVRILNPAENQKVLYKGTILGVCEPVTEVIDSVQDESSVIEKINSATLSYNAEVPEHLRNVWENTKPLLSTSQQALLKDHLLKFQSVFAKFKEGFGLTKVVKHRIDTGNAFPIKQNPRRIPPSLRASAENEVQKMLTAGIIEASNSPWASPVVLVRKKDNSLRFCVDYRKLNSVTTKDSYPIPRIDDSLDLLGEAQWFSTLDLASGYWQFEMHPEDKPKTAFCTQGGLFQFNVMPFGLASAPATFERLMEKVLAGLHWKICLVYLDDIIVFSRSFESHIENLGEVLSRIQEAGLKVAPHKCQLFRKEVQYLGHVVSNEGIRTDPKKTEAIVNWPQPQCVRDVRSFVGLCSYYRRFVKGFADIARPLHRLAEKGKPFQWNSDCKDSFEKLKAVLTSPPILAYPSQQGDYIIDADASNQAIGAVLSQKQDGEERVIAYYSRCFSKEERRYCVTRRELLAVVESLKHFHHYVYGSQILIRSDHGALRWLINFRNPEGQMARWLEVLGTYQYEIVHRAGGSHRNADGLSRRPCSDCKHCDKKDRDRVVVVDCGVQTSSDTIRGIQGKSMSVPLQPNWYESWSFETIREWQHGDPAICKAIQWKEVGKRQAWQEVQGKSPCLKQLWVLFNDLELRDGVLYKSVDSDEGREVKLVAPEYLRQEIFKLLHSNKTGGHMGIRRTEARINRKYWWPESVEMLRGGVKSV